MNKAYNRINWQNHPSDETPLNETNLNKIDVAADEIDNRVILLNTTKFDKSEAQGLFKDVSLDRSSGVITFTLYNGATKTLDTLLERIAINFDYDAATQRLVITLDDGAVKYVDMSALITQYEFLDTDTVAFSIDGTGKVSALVKEGSIQEKHLQPNYLADIKVEVAKAQASQTAAAKSESNAKASETAAKTSESNAAASATKAQSYAVGGTNSRTGEDTDNAKYYYEKAKETVGNSVTGIKGNAESSYRTGNVNITPENIGAVSKDEFNGLQIGGRNYLLNSSVEKTAESPSSNFSSIVYTSVIPEKLQVATETKSYTLSIWLTPKEGKNAFTGIVVGGVNGGDGWAVRFGRNDGKFEDISGSDMKKYSATFFIRNGQYLQDFVRLLFENTSIDNAGCTVHKIKLEKGTKATDWTPAPEDVDSSIAEVNGKLASHDTQLDDLTTNIQQNDVIANISSSSSSNVSEDITILSKDYRAFIIVLCNGDESDHTVINTYTWLSSMVNGYYRLELYDPSNNVYIGYIEFQTNSIYIYLNKHDEYYVDIYGLISL